MVTVKQMCIWAGCFALGFGVTTLGIELLTDSKDVQTIVVVEEQVSSEHVMRLAELPPLPLPQEIIPLEEVVEDEPAQCFPNETEEACECRIIESDPDWRGISPCP